MSTRMALRVPAVVIVVFSLAITHAQSAAMSPFAYFVGDWSCSGEFVSSHKPISSAVRFVFDDRTGALVKHHDDNPPNQFHAIELWAGGKGNIYDATIADSFGGVRHFHSPGWTGDEWVWSAADDDKTVERFSYLQLDPATMRIDWSVAKDGINFTVGDTLTCKRE